MAYLKQATSRAKTIVPDDSNDITPPNATAASGTSAAVHDTAGVIDSVTLYSANLGSGYITAPTITVSDGVGANARLEAVLDNLGAITSVTIIDGGSGYTGPYTVTVTGGTFPAAQPCILYIGFTAAATEITVTTDNGDIVKFNNPAVGQILGGASPINVRKVWNTGTSAGFDTAGALIGLW
jgi:hypothetical protein